jgi:predicted transcriptional regulator
MPDRKKIRAEIHEADRAVESRHYIKHEDMKAWLLSWGTKRELPPPKCVCGKTHKD